MCTVIIGFEPGAPVPVVLAGLRDELASRPWAPPARHWPDRPGLIGGLDLEAGGTWLAVAPAERRAAAVLNGHGTPAPERVRRSRGELPTAAAVAGRLPDLDLSVYDPFHLVLAEPDGVRLWSWDGSEVTEDKPGEGVEIIMNTADGGTGRDGRCDHFRPLFAAVPRPLALDDRPPREFWGSWLELACGGDVPSDDPRALVVRHELGGGRVWGTSSVTLVALAGEGVRYDFCPRPGDLDAWHRVSI